MRTCCNTDCMNRSTYVDSKGWVYCDEHRLESDGYRRVRKMAVWEQNRIAAGLAIPSYARTRKPEAA